MIRRFLSVPAGVVALLAASALAQPSVLITSPSLPAAAPLPTDPVEALGRYLRVLAVFPRNLDALTGAGRSSLAIGDANAAISFFARAQDIAPGDGRIKAGLASALVQMEQPKTALKLFDQAVTLGVPEAEIASDRGLARDLRGDTRRAQADYALALRIRPDDETTRRLAVSQAIGGDRAGAMATLDALLRRQDRAAWRVRAFVLALTGDRDGAEASARGAMPLPQAQALIPFFARLAGLKPGEKAAAVHLGQFPSDGRSSGNQELFAQADNAASPGQRSDAPLVPAGAPPGAAASATLSETLSRAPRRRPGSIDATPAAPALAVRAAVPAPIGYPAVAPAVASAAATTANMPGSVLPPASSQAYARSQTTLAIPPRSASAVPAAAPNPIAPAPTPLIVVPARTAELLTLPAMAPPVLAQPAGAPPVAIGLPAVRATEIPASTVASSDANAPIVETRFGPALARPAAAADAPVKLAAIEPVRQAPPISKPAPPVEERQVRVNGKEKVAEEAPPAKRNAKGKLADADADVAKAKPKLSAKDAKIAKAAAAKEKLADKDDKDSKTAKGKAKAKEAAAEKDKASQAPGGERYWVQVASGANKADLGRAWEKTKARAPKLLNGRTTYTSPWKASNRLLVGPFKTDEEAQGFVNTLGKAGMGGMQFTSRGKTKVERLSGD